MIAGYDMQTAKVLAELDSMAIARVKELKDDVLYVRDTFQKYGVTRENCKPRVPLRDLVHPQSPLEDEVARFNESEARIHAAVNDYSLPIPVQTAIAANVEMLYWDPEVDFSNIDETQTPSLN